MVFKKYQRLFCNHIGSICLTLLISFILPHSVIAEQDKPPSAANDIRVQAYLKLQQPYKNCVKAKLKKLYEISVSQCLKDAGLLASLNECQNLAEKSVNQQAQKKQPTEHCNKLKPNKADYTRLLNELQNSKPIK